jgi:signal transduction histidine kinase
MADEKDVLERERELYEYFTITHIMCIFILMVVLILSSDNEQIYPVFHIRLFIFLCFIGVILLFKLRSYNHFKKSKFISLKETYYIAFPLVMTVLILFLVGEHTYWSKIVFLLPVIIAASVAGMKAGLYMAILGTVILLLHSIIIEGNSIVQAIENMLIICGMMYVVGWSVGVTVDTVGKHREQLKANLLSLKEEISKRKKIENEVARLAQLNLVGEIAAGIGHEIRNPMTTVRGFLQLIGSKKSYAGDKEYFDLMISELDRANAIITEFLTMAKNKPVEKKANNINKIIQTLSPLLESDAIKHDVQLKVELEKIPDLFLDEKEIRQIVYNLIRNALEATPAGSIIIIRTFLDPEAVVLAVQDQGPGIDPKILDKIGTPFFTTKDHGTGLGLAVCYSIANRHNAAIKIETSSSGTTFYVKFYLERTNVLESTG